MDEKIKPLNEYATLLERKIAIIMDGKTLEFALEASMAKKLFRLGLLANSVICCRVSPKQKSDVFWMDG
jgi:phospholipid-transporting ATPase